jgi:hypothetical protein
MASGRRVACLNGGGRGIRTPVTLSGKAVFKTACFNRSHIPPRECYQQLTSSHSIAKQTVLFFPAQPEVRVKNQLLRGVFAEAKLVISTGPCFRSLFGFDPLSP